MDNPAHDAAVERAATAIADPTISQRVSDFVSQNRKALAIGAGVSVAAAATYLYYTSSRLDAAVQRPDSPTPPGETKKRSKKSKKSKSASSKRSRSPSSAEKGQNVPLSGNEEEKAVGDAKARVEDENDPLHLALSDIEGLDEDQRHTIANDLKTRGNKAYSSKRFSEAITLYSKAIECEPQAVFYSNRAACYTNMNESRLVIDDCTEALKLDPTYVKALNRRAAANEQLGGTDALFDALCDYTAAAILDGFKTEATTKSVDRVMKTLAHEKAAIEFKEREPRLPSVTFIKAYMEAFRKKSPDAVLDLSEDAPQGDQTLKMAFSAVEARNYVHAFSLVNEAVEQGISSEKLEAQAMNLRGTFKFIIGDAQGALEDLDRSTELDQEYVQSWVKKASVHMELGQPQAAFNDFEVASKIDPEDPDIYYHRGQVHFIMGDFKTAIEQYRKSTELDSTFIFSQIQHAVALYKDDQKAKAEMRFKKIMDKFGDTSPEVHNYYGELQLDQQKFDEAEKCFSRAIELEKQQPPPMNVVPMVNKSLVVFQSTKDFGAAEKLCRSALDKDPQCDIAVATLAQLLLQQNKIKDALTMFEQGASMARTEPELENHLTYALATKAQIAFVEAHPEKATELGLGSI